MLILTGYDDAYAPIGDQCVPSIETYANLWSHEFECVREFEKDSHPSWQKLQLILKRLGHHEWILWMDADVEIVNYTFDVEAIIERYSSSAVIFSRDWNPVSPFSAGVALYQSCPMTFHLLTRAFLLGKQWANKPLWDQSALQHTLDLHPHIKEHVTILRDRVFCSVPAWGENQPQDPFQPGDFCCHFTGLDSDVSKKLEYIKAIMSKSGNGPSQAE